MVVRVTRLMEYEYPTVEAALADMENWQIPAQGVRTINRSPAAMRGPMTIRSAVIGPVYGPAAEAIHTAVPLADDEQGRDHLEEIADFNRAEEMRRELAQARGLDPQSPDAVWEQMIDDLSPAKGEPESEIYRVTRDPELATVVLFKPGGKYYTQEDWHIPAGAVGPEDMKKSGDFRRISGGPVLVPSQEPWGYPFLLVAS